VQGVLGGEGGTPPDVYNLFAASGNDVGILRYADNYYLAADLGSGRVAVYALGPSTSFVQDGEAPEIGAITLGYKVRALDEHNAAVTLNGTWNGPNANAAYFGGDYYYTIVDGNYCEWTTGATATQCGIMSAAASTGGLAIVSIDGDKTLATSLPTAQQCVDAGTLDASALVGGGGTLNPTDRLFDTYKFRDSALYHDGLPYYWCEFATGLTAGAHVVRITNTAYHSTGSSNYRLNVSGVWDNSVDLFSHTNAALLLDTTASNADGSRWEFAFLLIPTGAVGAEWIGHGNTEFVTSVVITVNGVEKTPVNYNLFGGAEVKIALTTYTRHTELAGVDVMTITREYVLTTAGLQCTGSIVFNLAATSTTCYLGMLPAQASWNRGRVGAGSAITLSTDDDSYVGNTAVQYAYLWEQAGNWGGFVWLPYLATVGNWANAKTLQMAIQDRADELNKIYPARISDAAPVTIAQGSVWTFDIRYRVQYFASAETTLA
jgi:hypothetical protein